MNTPVLRRVMQRKNTKKIYGFDIETHNENKDFLCASFWSDDYQVTMYSKAEVIMELRNTRYRNSIIAASNLAFDFFGTLDGMEDMRNFTTLFRGSDLIAAKTYVNDEGFFQRRRSKGKGQNYTLEFIDSNNYARMSVEKLGKIIGLPKLEKPKFLGQYPESQEQWKELVEYNMRDSEVSCRFIRFIFRAFEDLGCTPKLTISSTAMNLFKCKYIGEERYYRQPEEWIREQFNAYYGGRTECFARGIEHELKCYDYNSLYPSIAVTAKLPDPNFMRVNTLDTVHYIEEYEGCALVDVECPDMQYPLLPFKYEHKTMFPVGTFTGWYTNIELREALRLGYRILKVHKNYWAQKTCNPLSKYMTDLYKKRLDYKKEGNPMETVVKLLMNGLTGKFGQKYLDKDNWISSGATQKELDSYDMVERVGDFFRVSKDSKPAAFCIPLWIAYITAIGRIKITADATLYKAYYIDTDCIHTKCKVVPTSNELGAFKLEYDITEALYVRPKMYALQTINSDGTEGSVVKIKGLGIRMPYDEFKKKLQKPEVKDRAYVISKTYTKFTKFKEAKRRGKIPNELAGITKNFLLNDEKRDWNDADFKPSDLLWSTPIRLVNGIPERVLSKMKKKALEAFKENVRQDMREFIKSDKFDRESVGFDISEEEFIDNEKWFERHD